MSYSCNLPGKPASVYSYGFTGEELDASGARKIATPAGLHFYDWTGNAMEVWRGLKFLLSQ
jgi:hypothetical protein